MTQLKVVTDLSFASDVLASDKPVIVDFWAPWCVPCRTLTPVLEQIAREHSDTVDVVAVNVDENPTIAAEYGIISIPSVYGFRDGVVVHSMHGARNKQDVESEFAELLG